ncbi:hypothetical protein BH11BAC1_BH11BAC1_17200 [soil metagenome]
MKSEWLFSIVLIFYRLFCSASISYCQGLESIVHFASLEQSKELLKTEDDFTRRWSQFDIDSRLHKINSKKEDLLNYITSQVREWKNEEMKKVTSILDSIDAYIHIGGFKINFPKEIFFIKTTGEEEGGASGYTRGNYIAFKETAIQTSQDQFMQLIIHELFHILSRHDSAFKLSMYNIIGFNLMNEITYPDGLNNRRITNPDAPKTDSYITLNIENAPVDCAMLLYSNKQYDGGDFFKYLEVGFLRLTGGVTKEINIVNGEQVIYNMEMVSGFHEKVGMNTDYTIHPEEVLADNFVLSIENAQNQKSQWLVDKMQNKLRE